MNISDYSAFKNEVIGVFDRAAPLYDQVGIKQFTHYAKLLVDRLQIPTGASILDIASGRGALLFASAERVGTAGHVIGVDLAPAMVQETRAEVLRHGLPQIDLLLMDADNLAFQPQSFDFILCGFALHFLDYERALPQFLHLLKLGGRFAAIFPYVPQNVEDFERWKWLFQLTREVFPADFVPPPAWTAPRRLNKPELITPALEKAGFVDVQTEHYEARLYFKDENDWWQWEWSQGSRFWIEGMSDTGREHFRQEAFKQLQNMKDANGISTVDGALFAIATRP